MLSTAPATIRAVTHLDVTKEDVDRTIRIISDIASRGLR